MKLFVTFILLFSLPIIALGYIDLDGDAVERGNNFVDKLLRDMVEEHGDEYDPYEMEDSVIGFHRKIIVNISGEAKLHAGYIRGLKSLHRADDCYLTEENGRLRIRADMGAGILDLHYAGSVKFMTFGPTIEVHGKVPYIEVVMEMTVNSKNGKEGRLEKFYIEDIRGMQVWITGLGPLNWAVNTLISAVTTIFQRFMYRAVENKIEKHISDRIKNYQFPVDEITTFEPTTEKETTVETTTVEKTTLQETTVEPTTEETTTKEETTVEITTEETTAEPTTEKEVTETKEETTVEPTTEAVTEPEEETTVEPTTEEEITEEEEETTTEEVTEAETTVEPTTEEEITEEKGETTTEVTEAEEETTVEQTTEEITEEEEETTVEPTIEEITDNEEQIITEIEGEEI